MKLIKQITDLNKAIIKENKLGFVPTMGNLHKGHESLIRISKKKCSKTLVTIFVNPTQFNNKRDYKTYPRSINNDLKILKRLKVDYVYLPTINQIFDNKKYPKILLNKSQKILCAKYRKGHFEGVLDVMNRFVKLIMPHSIFMGEKDYQQFYLVKNFIEKKYTSKVILCGTIRDQEKIALSSRNKLIKKNNLHKHKLITNILINLKKKIYKDKNKSKKLINEVKKDLIIKFKIKIDYLECRSKYNLSLNIYNKPFKLFVAYYLNKVRLIDNF